MFRMRPSADSQGWISAGWVNRRWCSFPISALSMALVASLAATAPGVLGQTQPMVAPDGNVAFGGRSNESFSGDARRSVGTSSATAAALFAVPHR